MQSPSKKNRYRDNIFNGIIDNVDIGRYVIGLSKLRNYSYLLKVNRVMYVLTYIQIILQTFNN